MRTIYQNILFKAVEEAELNVVDFSRKEENEVFTIIHNGDASSFYFAITITSPPKKELDVLGSGFANAFAALKTPLFEVKMVPGQIASFMVQNYFNWDKLLEDFKRWLKWVKDEIATPDLWAEAAKTAQLFAPTSTPTDDKFTRTELAEVQGQLRLLQQSFTSAALPEAAQQKLIELTQTAAVKAEGLTKKDWQNWIIGGFISAIASCALNPTQAAEVLKLVKAAFGGLFLH